MLLNNLALAKTKKKNHSILSMSDFSFAVVFINKYDNIKEFNRGVV